MKVCRSIFNLGLISKQYKKETKEEFDLNKVIEWLGKRQLIEIDNDLLESSETVNL